MQKEKVMKIKLIADSACSVPSDIVEKYDIEIVPLGIIFGNEEFKDGVDITDSEFFEKLKNSGVNPTTSQVNQYEWQEVLGKYTKDFDHVIVMTLSSKMSGTHQSAKNAISELGASNIHLFDTQTVSIPAGLIVYATAQYIATGAEIEQVLQKAQDYINTVDVYATFESLKQLKAGGRISHMSAIIGTVLKVKIVLTAKNGMVHAHDKVISSKKALRRIKEIFMEDFNPDLPILFGEGDFKETVTKIANEYHEDFGITNYIVTSLGSTISTHTGPQSFGVAYFRNKPIRNL